MNPPIIFKLVKSFIRSLNHLSKGQQDTYCSECGLFWTMIMIGYLIYEFISDCLTAKQNISFSTSWWQLENKRTNQFFFFFLQKDLSPEFSQYQYTEGRV